MNAHACALVAYCDLENLISVRWLTWSCVSSFTGQVSKCLKSILEAHDRSLFSLSRCALLSHENMSHTKGWTTEDELQVEDKCWLTGEEKHNLLAATMESWAGSVALFDPCGDGPLSRPHGVSLPPSLQPNSLTKALASSREGHEVRDEP